MAQLFIDSASITNLIISSSYIGSGSTSFNKENSFLRTNNGVRQGILNRNFSTADATYSHIEGYNNSGNSLHVEGANNTTNSNAGGHIEGANNTTSNIFQYSHIEGTNNYSSDSSTFTLCQNHVEGGFNILAGGGWGKQHLEGYNNYFRNGQRVGSHVEGFNNQIGTSGAGGEALARWSHIEGYSSSLLFSGEQVHIEGAEHIQLFGFGYGKGNHIEGRNNGLLALTNGNTTGIHIEGYSNSYITAIEAGAIHICGISCSSNSTNNAGSFINGLGSQTYYTGSCSFISGQFNTSNLSSYSNISPTTNKIWSNFTIGGGLNNSTNATIFEVTFISSGSSSQLFPTRSIIMPWVSESGDFADDTAAATGGVPLGGFYRTGNSLKIRLS